MRTRRLVRRLAWIALAALILLWGPWHWLPHQRLADRVLVSPTRVFARPLVLAPGLSAGRASVAAHLRQAGYRAVRGADVARGEFQLDRNRWRIGLRAFQYPDGVEPGGTLTVDLEAGVVRRLRGPDGEPREALFLEPEEIGTLFGDGDEDRVLVPLEELPQPLLDAVLVAEDRRFFLHPGVDPIRIAGAIVSNLRGRELREGGSTLTQQLVKNVHLSPERTLGRKLREVVLALAMEVRYSKQEILEAYLNQVYLGQDAGRGIHGVGRAARFFFAKDVAELSVADAALLAAIIRAPNALSPLRHPERARKGRDVVLDALLSHGRIDAATHARARDTALGVRRTARPARFAGHFLSFVRGRLEDRFSERELSGAGLRIFTTLDGTMQRAADHAVREGLARLEKGYPLLRRRSSPLQAALVALDPASGDVLALVGSRDFAASPFDRATAARRQPGSLFKPVVVLAALESDVTPPLTLSSILEDEPLTLEVEGETWRPANHDGRHRGPVSVRRALELSLNVPLARLGLETGLVRAAETARRLGVTSPLRPIPSLSLGAFETTPFEIASCYSVLASGGVRTRPRTTLAALSHDGDVLTGEPLVAERAFDPAVAYVVSDALRGVVERGTARNLRALGVAGPWAGKTGTTNGYRDAWFAGYARDLAVVVWVGFDDGARVGLTGAQAAVPIFARFVREAVGARGPRALPVPGGVEVARVRGSDELFVSGTGPRRR